MIVVECNADERLVRALGVERRQVRHERSKGRVLNRLRKSDASIGVIDEDPDSSQPRELKQYVPREKGDDFGGLRLLTHQSMPLKRIVIIRPRLEEWLYRRAKENQINPQDYGLPSDSKALHEIPHYHEKPGFADFLNELLNDREVTKLAEWLRG